MITKIRRQKTHPQRPPPVVLRPLGRFSQLAAEPLAPLTVRYCDLLPADPGIVLQRKNQVAVRRRGIGINRERLPVAIDRPAGLPKVQPRVAEVGENERVSRTQL